MNKRVIYEPGHRFGRLTVIENLPVIKPYTETRCKCDCGNEKIVITFNLTNGTVQSCGCLRRERVSKANTKHGKHGTKLYQVWRGMFERCYNAKGRDYKNWGGRGITMCSEWQDFKVFQSWAISNGYRESLQLDRINNNGNYSPHNCRWANPKEQAYNKRNTRLITIDNVTKTIAGWAEVTGLKNTTIVGRIKMGWSGNQLLLPVRGCR